MKKLPCSWICSEEIVKYYLYSITPKKHDFMAMFGNEWENHYKAALQNATPPSLTGYIIFYRNFIKTSFSETIIPKKRN